MFLDQKDETKMVTLDNLKMVIDSDISWKKIYENNKILSNNNSLLCLMIGKALNFE